jgi:hypothetical protein
MNGQFFKKQKNKLSANAKKQNHSSGSKMNQNNSVFLSLCGKWKRCNSKELFWKQKIWKKMSLFLSQLRFEERTPLKRADTAFFLQLFFKANNTFFCRKNTKKRGQSCRCELKVIGESN